MFLVTRYVTKRCFFPVILESFHAIIEGHIWFKENLMGKCKRKKKRRKIKIDSKLINYLDLSLLRFKDCYTLIDLNVKPYVG